MQLKALLFATIMFAACGGLPMPGFLGGGGNSQPQVTQTSTSSSTTTEEMNVNGRPVEVEGERDDDEEEVRPSKRTKTASAAKKTFGKTCHKNEECEDEACFVGGGNLGYCTKMCSSWSECPSHWECKRANNAPQKICMQDN